MKLTNFPDSTHSAMGVNYYSDDDGYTVIALSLDKADLKKLKEGPLYIVCGPGYKVPPPLQFYTQSPFKKLTDGKEAKESN